MKVILSIIALLSLTSCSELKEYVYKHTSNTDTIVSSDSDQKPVGIKNSDLTHAKTIKENVLASPADIKDKIVVRVKPKLSKKILKYCELIDKKFYLYGWGKSQCKDYHWHHVRSSHLGRPLIWLTYGDEKAHKKSSKNMTMIFCTVHGDEITPTKLCFDIIEDLEARIDDPLLKDQYRDSLIVVAPIVNPDSFFKKYPTRTNQRKVDINRNFPTKDWKKSAIKLWKSRYKSDKRRFPGHKALSEQETIFQVNLIKRYKPNKIISVHAPLTIIDYDGPHKKRAQNANQLLVQMSNDARGYRIKDYPFFTGSLGNWAGNERHIPTYTLELPSSDNRQSKKYWNQFKEAIRSAVRSDLTKDLNVADGDNADPVVLNKKL
jgi:murein peptide amidase A